MSDRLTANDTGTLMEQLLYEVKRIVVGQDKFLERVLVAMLAQGHLLVEGRRWRARSPASSSASSSRPIWCRPT
jgi:hypothetical protein